MTRIGGGNGLPTEDNTRRHLSSDQTPLNVWKIVGIFYLTYFTGWAIFSFTHFFSIFSRTDSYIVSLVSAQLSMVAIGSLTLWHYRGLMKAWSFSVSIWSAVIAVGAGLVGAILSGLIQRIVGAIAFPRLDPFTLTVVLVIGPVVEELFCRGFMLNGLLLKHSATTSVLISAVLVAGWHESFWPALAVQLIISILFLKFRRSLAVSALAHIVANIAVAFPNRLLLN